MYIKLDVARPQLSPEPRRSLAVYPSEVCEP
jgi:hypothetical protein